MRSTFVGVALLLCTPAFAAAEREGTVCTIKLNSTYRLAAPAGWRFVECSPEVRDQSRVFSLEPSDPALRPQTANDSPLLTMYGGPVGRGTVEAFLASDRESHSNDFSPKDGEGLRTADRRDVRVLEMTSREPPFAWLVHGLLKVGQGVFWVVLECRQEAHCEASYSDFKRLVGSLQVLRPNEVGGR